MTPDLDAIEALTSDPYQYAQTSPLVTRGYLSALLAELRATTADLAVAVEVARERGEEIERLNRRLGMTRDNAADDLAELRAENERLRDVERDYMTRSRTAGEYLQEMNRLRAGIEALHRPVHVVGSWNGGLRLDPICETCHGKAGIHECGCWADEDLVPECAECTGKTGKRQIVTYPCPTIRALDALLRGAK